MIKKLIIQIIVIQNIFGADYKYGEKQIVNILYEYFSSSKNSPTLIGHQFFQDSDERVFQIDIKTDIEMVNEAIIFSFEGINKIANLSKVNYSHAIIIIHFNENALPAVAESNIHCSRKFFIEKTYNENQWRKHCLTIKNYH